MARINLLPWRDELRKKRQTEFGIMAVVGIVVALALGYYSLIVVDDMIEHQKQRNAFLEREVKALDKKIVEIRELEKIKRALLARMEVIQQLQKSRPEIVHFFDELARTVPNGVSLDLVSQQQNRVEIKGQAQSNARVSSYMRRINNSEWLTKPKLLFIETGGKDSSGSSQFKMQLEQISTSSEQEE